MDRQRRDRGWIGRACRRAFERRAFGQAAGRRPAVGQAAGGGWTGSDWLLDWLLDRLNQRQSPSRLSNLLPLTVSVSGRTPPAGPDRSYRAVRSLAFPRSAHPHRLVSHGLSPFAYRRSPENRHLSLHLPLRSARVAHREPDALLLDRGRTGTPLPHLRRGRVRFRRDAEPRPSADPDPSGARDGLVRPGGRPSLDLPTRPATLRTRAVHRRRLHGRFADRGVALATFRPRLVPQAVEGARRESVEPGGRRHRTLLGGAIPIDRLQ